MQKLLICGVKSNLGKQTISLSKQRNLVVACGIDDFSCSKLNFCRELLVKQFPYYAYNNFDSVSVDCNVIIDYSLNKFTSPCLDYAKNKNIPVVILDKKLDKTTYEKIKNYSKFIPICLSKNYSYNQFVVNSAIKNIEKALKFHHKTQNAINFENSKIINAKFVGLEDFISINYTALSLQDTVNGYLEVAKKIINMPPKLYTFKHFI